MNEDEVVTTTSGTTLPADTSVSTVTTSLDHYFGDLLKHLTVEEETRLQDLKIEHEAKIKDAKINVFKKYPPEMRQFAINAILWKEFTTQIEAVSVPKSEDLKKLEYRSRHTMLSMGTVNVSGSFFSTGYASINYQFNCPEGLTSDDLKQAHLEATLEENILDNGQT